MNSKLHLIHQTTYAELLDQCQSDAFTEAFPEQGFFTPKQMPAGGRRYWYFELPASEGSKQKYVGPETPELLDKIERHKAARNNEKERRSLVSTLVRSAGLPRLESSLGEVVKALADAGVFRLYGVLVGTIAYQTYPAMLGIRLPHSAVRTVDVDIAQREDISIAVQDETRPMLEVLQTVDPKFRAVPHLHDSRRSTTYLVDGGVRVDFLTPNQGPDTDETLPLKSFGTDAEQLRFLDFLIKDPEPAVVLYGAGIFVLVPSPLRYAVHKLIIAQRRKVGTGKREKDLKQSETLLDVLTAQRPDDLRAIWEEASGRGKKWESYLSTGLAQISPTVRDKTLKAVGLHRSFVAGLDLQFAAEPASYDFSRDVVVFWGRAGNQRMRCHISREALEDHFGADGLSKEGRVDVFLKNRAKIEALAKTKFLFRVIEDLETILIRTTEVEALMH